MRQAFFFIQAVQKRKWRHRGINNGQLTQGVRQVYLSPGLNHYILFSLKFWHHLNRQFLKIKFTLFCYKIHIHYKKLKTRETESREKYDWAAITEIV